MKTEEIKLDKVERDVDQLRIQKVDDDNIIGIEENVNRWDKCNHVIYEQE